MESISGVSNWKLRVARDENSVTILRALTCDEAAELPDTLFGLPVTGLSDHALAPSAAGKEEGEAVEITCGVPKGEFDNKSLRTLTLPSSLRTIGNYAFMNCRRLKTVILTDAVNDTGTGIFMNCREFENIDLTRSCNTQGTFLAQAVSALSGYLCVTVHTAAGETAKFVFPEYYEVHTENGPTHFFNYTIEGGGYPYHHVFEMRVMHTEAYDALWPGFISRDYDRSAALRLAWFRLRYPVELKAAAAEGYRRYISGMMKDALQLVIDENDAAGLRMLLAFPAIRAEELSHAQSLARENQRTELLAILLEKQHQSFGAGRRKTYDF